LFHQKIYFLLDQILDQFFPTNEVIKIDKIELDIGQVTRDNLEQKIVQAIQSQLPLILAQTTLTSQKKWIQQTPQKSTYELLDFYLKTGYFPWWRQQAKGFKADLWVQDLLKKDSLLARKLLGHHLNNPQARQRMDYQLSENTMQEVKTVMMGSQKLDYDWYLDQLIQLHQHVKIRATTRKNYRKYIDDLLLNYLGQGGQMETSPQDFGRYFLENVAQKYHLSPDEIYSFYQIRLPKKGIDKAQKNWLTVLENWMQDENQQKGFHRLSTVELVMTFLQKGILPNPKNQVLSLGDLEELIIKLSEEGHMVWLERLKKGMDSQNVLKRISEQFKPSTKEALLQLLYGGRLYNLIKTIQGEIVLLLQIKKAPPALEKKLLFFYQNALLYFYADFQEHTDFSTHFIVFLKDYLEKAVPLDWTKWWERLSKKQQSFIRASPLLVRFFLIAEAKKIFTGNLKLSNSQLVDKLEQLPDFIQFLKKIEKQNSSFKGDINTTSSSKDQLKSILIKWSQSVDFYQHVAPQLSLLEIANIARIIIGKETKIYEQKLEVVKKIVRKNPLPRKKAKQGMSDIKVLWLGLIKAKHQQQYHGNRGKRFWHHWMGALSLLLDTSEETLWVHFQQLPEKGLPNLANLEDYKIVEPVSLPSLKEQEEPAKRTVSPLNYVHFLETGQLPLGLNLHQLDEQLQALIQKKTITIRSIFQTQIGRFNRLKYFRKLAPKTIQLAQQTYFSTHQKSLQRFFTDFSTIVKQSTVLPVLSMISLNRDIRLGLLYTITKAGNKLPEIKTLAADVLQVISQFYAVTYNTLLVDMAKMVQGQRPKLKTNIATFFQAIDIPKPSYAPEQTFFYFLKQGVFPARGTFHQVADIEIWLGQKNNKSFSALFKTNLTKALNELPQFKRLITQFSSKSIIRINQLLANSHWEDLMKIMVAFQAFFQEQALPEKAKQQLNTATHSGLLHFLVQYPHAPYDTNTLFQVFGKHLYYLMDMKVDVALVDAIGGKEILENKQTNSLSIETATVDEVGTPNWWLKQQPIWQQLINYLIKIPSLNLKENQLIELVYPQLLQLSLVEKGVPTSTYFKAVLEKIAIHKQTTLPILIEKILIRLAQQAEKSASTLALKKQLKIAASSKVIPNKKEYKTNLAKEQQITENQLEEIEASSTNTHTGNHAEDTILSPPLQEKLTDIITYLNTGSFTNQQVLKSPAEVEQAMLLFLKLEPVALYQHLKTLTFLPKAIERIERHFKVSTLQKLITAIDKITSLQLSIILNNWQAVKWPNLLTNYGIKPLPEKIIFTRILAISLRSEKIEKPSVELLENLLKLLVSTKDKKAGTLISLIIQQLKKESKSNVFLQTIQVLEKRRGAAIEQLITRTLQKDLEKRKAIYVKNYQAEEYSTIIDFYAIHQQIPWWATETKELGTVLLNYARKQMPQMRLQFQKIWTNKKQQKNLLKVVPEKDWLALGNILYQQYTTLIEATAKLITLAIETTQLATATGTDLKVLKWSAILAYFWKNPAFSSDTFVVQTLEKVIQKADQPLKKWQPILLFIAEEEVRKGDIAFARLKDILYKWKVEPKELNLVSYNSKEKSKIGSVAKTSTIAKEKVPAITPIANSSALTTNQNDTLIILQNIQHFLAFGAMRNKTVFPNKRSFLNQFTRYLDKYPKLLKVLLIDLLANPAVTFRLLSTLPAKLIWRIIQLLYGAKMPRIDAYRLDIMYLLPGLVRRFSKTKMDNFFQYQLLTYFPTANKGLFQLADFYTHILERLAKQEDKNPLTLLHQLKAQIENGTANTRGNWSKLIPLIYKRLKDQIEKGQQRIKWSLEGNNDSIKKEIMYVNNAGLAVIAPFLPRYFKMLQMLDEAGKFKDAANAIRAVHLIQYIATGQSETEEPLLVFNKLLCGLPIATPVPKGIDLTQQEEEMTQGMLNAILAHWKGMGTASLEGLRGGFLIRDGRLEWHSDGYWNLDVEKKAYDVIMRSLPWSISMMQFSWLDYRIQVTWY